MTHSADYHRICENKPGDAYEPQFMEFRLREFPKMFPDGKYPPNTLLIVDRLVKEAFLVEVQTIAAV